MIKQLIYSAKIEKEIMLRVGLRMIDNHEVEEVDALVTSHTRNSKELHRK